MAQKRGQKRTSGWIFMHSYIYIFYENFMWVLDGLCEIDFLTLAFLSMASFFLHNSHGFAFSPCVLWLDNSIVRFLHATHLPHTRRYYGESRTRSSIENREKRLKIHTHTHPLTLAIVCACAKRTTNQATQQTSDHRIGERIKWRAIPYHAVPNCEPERCCK